MDPRPKTSSSDQALDIFLVVLFFVIFTLFCYLVHYPLIIPLYILFLGIYLNHFKKATARNFINLGFLLTLIIFVTEMVKQYSDLPPFYIPVAAIAMLTMLLFNDLQLAFIMSFIASTLVSLILGGDFGMMLIFFLGSLTGAYIVRDAQMRGKLIISGFFVSLINIVCLVLLNPQQDLVVTKRLLVHYLYPLMANGLISSFIVVATLKIFESAFRVLTNFSLVELTDRNQPLLKRMALEAPGTWQHSLIVGQLTESAAEAIGANALLARAGAYYHDIGKLEKPDYFTENQSLGDNKHDAIEPSMSRLIILNHVKEGVELAKKHKINPLIIDFIPQHHGTSLMHYFYQRALEESKEDEEVNENDFRYPGPKPQSKETAITLLADSVEGATRVLEDPVPTRIEETVRKVTNNKFIDGQLDECNLTLKEIEKICSTFTRILSAIYHGRVKYPEKKNGHSSRKPSEKSSTQSPPD